jgi:hypothetical protein
LSVSFLKFSVLGENCRRIGIYMCIFLYTYIRFTENFIKGQIIRI